MFTVSLIVQDAWFTGLLKSSNLVQAAYVVACIILCATLLLIPIVLSSLERVSEKEWMVIERFGRINRIVSGGMHIVWPLIDRERRVHWRNYADYTRRNRIERLPLATSAASSSSNEMASSLAVTRPPTQWHVLDPEPMAVMTAEGTPCTLDVLLRYKVRDVRLAVTAVSDLHVVLVEGAATFLLRSCARIPEKKMLADINKELARFESEWKPLEDQCGVQCKLDVQRLTPSPEVVQVNEQAILQQRRAAMQMEQEEQEVKLDALRQQRALTAKKVEAQMTVHFYKELEAAGMSPTTIAHHLNIEAWHAVARRARHTTIVVPHDLSALHLSTASAATLFDNAERQLSTVMRRKDTRQDEKSS